MIWLFKKKAPPLTTEQWAAQFPPAPCGEQTMHYEWEKIIGMVCPACHAQRKARDRDAELDRLADKIVARLNRNASPSVSQSSPPVASQKEQPKGDAAASSPVGDPRA